ncbi:sensor histidine kinase [Streptomyces drozdowiczii]|uniref:histidine kinase n=1 Tax=Streptomyces drozdowiczii TaxID=202862 RepID=A0ABY6PP25_9ACTN|nr:nitrate- and nitrite sensing domain-containing protein [Streptomyces drozdowiczii]MCX0246680.1 nitrate- and nitrite sensing domain-containing protein [Streptomyces drozdowiczii]UZK53847.1 nitrate- and nitrite sensing domain-containing protein [Streptomyces drozdowiczii]
MKINRRLVLLVTAPLTVAVTFSALALAPATNQALQANRLADMVDVAAGAADLTHQLQRERAAATALVSDQGDSSAFQASSDATDKSIASFKSRTGGLSEVPGSAQEALDRIDRFIDELPALRAQVRSGSTTISALAFGYRIVIADLNGYRDGIAQADGVDADIADRIRAAAALSEAAEHTAQQQITVMRAQAAGGFTAASQRTFDASRLGYTESTGVMFSLGPSEWRSWLERTLSGPKALESRKLEDRIGRTDTSKPIGVTPKEWQKASDDRQTLLHQVEGRIDDSVAATVDAERTRLLWTAGAEVALVLLTLVGVVLVAVRLGRVMIRRLRDLRNAAHEVAHTRLPAVMSELSQPGALSGSTPEQVAERTGNPVETTSGDEIGEVGEAFNAVHHEAVRLAAEQARVHEQFAETLVRVARRGAQLTSVMVSELDTVQRDEADPERMKTLFALDHLAIRMERNTNNLLVLGGYGNARVRSADIGCSTVIVAAAQQIERFDRVSLGAIEAGIGIAARAVHDVAHILAELLDNATRFSPPDAQVGVAVWRLWDRAVVQIVDEGVGISADRRAVLNAGLREPKAGIGDVRSMGLHVVARLAARHGIVVELRDSSGPGTIAEVTLPKEVLAEVSEEPTPPTENGFESPRTVVTRRKQDTVRGRVGRPVGAGVGARAGAPGTREEHEAPARTEAADAPAPHPVHDEPASRIAGVSASGLPVRKRTAPQQWPAREKRAGTEQRSGAGAPRPTPRRRDSRQVSDVLAAYAQGISRSTNPRGRPANNDDTERTKK